MRVVTAYSYPVLREPLHFTIRDQDQCYSYPYLVRTCEEDWLEFTTFMRSLRPDRYILITEDRMPTHLVEKMYERLHPYGECMHVSFPGGEETKTYATVGHLLEQALVAGASKQSVIVALGGGVCGNVAGMVAAQIRRGAQFVQVPTTWLAATDSVLSLKQAVNSQQTGKNQIGLYYAPRLVFFHLSYIRSLWEVSPEAIRSGNGEMIKNVVAILPDYEEFLLQTLNPKAVYSDADYCAFAQLCFDAKQSVMRDDARERGIALILEAGHTIAHAAEFASALARHGERGTARDEIQELSHGLAVGLGLLVEARIARLMKLMTSRDEERIARLVALNGGPTRFPSYLNPQDIMDWVECDNKGGNYLPRKKEHTAFVLLEQPGIPHQTGGTVLTHVPHTIVREAVEAFCA